MSFDLLRRLETSFENDQHRAAVKTVIRNSFVRHLHYPEGQLKAALILGYVNLETLNPERIKANRCALVYLNLSSGILFGMRIEGDIDYALTHLHGIASHLHDLPYDESIFPSIENKLSEDFNNCEIKLFRHAPVYPDQSLFRQMNQQYGFGSIKYFTHREGINLSETALADLGNQFSNIFNEHHPAIEAFKNGLDQGVLHTLNIIDKQFSEFAQQILVYNWLVSDDPIRQRNRKQAVQILPWLMPIVTGIRYRRIEPSSLCEKQVDDESGQSARLSIIDAIETGTPLFDSIAAILNIPKDVIIWSRYRVLPELEFIKWDQVDLLLRVLSWIHPTLRPVDHVGWMRFESQFDCYLNLIASTFRIPIYLLTSYNDSGANFSSPAYETILINWFSRDNQLQLRGQWEKRIKLIAAINGTADFMMALATALEVDLAKTLANKNYRNDMQSFILGEWLGNSSIDDAAALSERWHHQINKFNVANDNPDEHIGLDQKTKWPMLIGEMYFGERTITEITSEQGLIDEGREMKNCLRNNESYATACRNSQCHIFSIRDKSGERKSTLHLALDKKLSAITIHCHKGVHNSDPSQSCQDAAMALLKCLNGRTYQMAIASIRRRMLDSELPESQTPEGKESAIVDRLDQEATVAWDLIQSHKLGIKFRRAYSQALRNHDAIDQKQESS